MSSGSRVGPYRLESQLGRGGMGSVWVGVHTAAGARHAVKLLDVADDPELRARLGREAEALGRLGAHPNLVTVHGSGVDGGRPWIAMALVTGGDLGARLRTGPLAPPAVLELGKALAAGLIHAHARGVLHRDLKPSNVVFGEDGAPRLVDFGVARVAGAAALTLTGAALGTPGYSAPEQLGGGEVDARADVYGLGAVLYHALTGQPAFVAATPIAAVAGALQGPPAPTSVAPALRRDLLAQELEAIVLRALAFDPGARFASAEALWRALAEAGGPGRPQRRPRGVAALVAGAAIAGGLVAAGLAGGAPPVSPTGPPPAEPPAPTPPPARREAGVEALLAGARSPDEVLDEAGAVWADPAARPALALEVGAALLLGGGPGAASSAWPTGGLAAQDAAWLAVCAGRPSGSEDPALRRVARLREAALALERASESRLERPFELMEAAERLIRAAEAAKGPAWPERLARVHAQRQLASHAETFVHFASLAVAQAGEPVVTVHQLFVAAEALEPGSDAAALRVLHRWALRPRRGDALSRGVTLPGLEPGLVLPRHQALLGVVHGALSVLDQQVAHLDLATCAELRRRTAALCAAAGPLGGFGADPAKGLDRPLCEVMRQLRDEDAFAASWLAWLARGTPAAGAALDEAWRAAELVFAPPDRSRHRARVLLMRGQPEEARAELEAPGEPARDWRAAYLFECELLAGRLEAAADLIPASPRDLRVAQQLGLDAAAPTLDADALRARAEQVRPSVVHLPWRGREAARALVEAAATAGWRPKAGAPPWP